MKYSSVDSSVPGSRPGPMPAKAMMLPSTSATHCLYSSPLLTNFCHIMAIVPASSSLMTVAGSTPVNSSSQQ